MSELLTQRGIKQLVPHRFPILAIDCARLETPDEVWSKKNITGSEPCYAHLPDDAEDAAYAYPLALLQESFFQTAALLAPPAWRERMAQDGAFPLLGSVTGFKLLSPVYPGEVLEHRVRRELTKPDTTIVSGESFVGDRPVAQVKRVVFVLSTPDAPKKEGADA